MSTMTLAKAITSGLDKVLESNDKALLMGEDIGKLGGVYRVTDGLQDKYGAHRVIDSPLGEAGIVGSAVGMALRGFCPLVEIQFDGFVFPAYSQITTQLAKMHARSEGRLTVPVVIRIPYGGGIGSIEHHSESPEALFAHTAGLRIITPSNANDAYWMIQQAIQSPDPVLFFEPKAKYWAKGEVDPAAPAVELHRTRIARPGTDCTVVAWGAMVTTALQAAEVAQSEGTSIEVVDLRSLSPIDYEPLLESVRRTGRLVVAQEAQGGVSLGSEIAAHVAEQAFYSLQAPVLRVAGYDVPFPPARLEGLYLPDADRVLEAVDRTMHY